MSNSNTYDVVVIGGGTAGLTAGLFAARYGLKTVILDSFVGGGQIVNAEQLENVPGFVPSIEGHTLAHQLREQAIAAGATLEMAEATGVRVEGESRVVATSSGEFTGKAVIVAAGSSLRKLGIPGEESFEGRGVSHCAACDGPFFTDQVAGVVGGGDSALDEAETLTQFASQVIIFHRRDSLREKKALQDRILPNPKISVKWNTTVEEILGDAEVEGVRTRDSVTGEESRVDLSGLFIFVGLDPNTAFLQGLLPLDNAGHIKTDLWMATEVPGVFAAGDIRQHSASQVVTAAGDGATAAIAAFRYIQVHP